MIVLGLDISQRGTGLAVGDASGPPRTWRQPFPQPDRGELGIAFREFLLDQIVMHAPRVIVFEAPMVASGVVSAGLDQQRAKLGLAFLVEMVARQRGIPCFDVHVQTARRQILGSGRPKDPKRAVTAFCAAHGWEVGGSHDRADAAVVWAFGHFHWGNRKGIAQLLSRAAVAGLAGARP